MYKFLIILLLPCLLMSPSVIAQNNNTEPDSKESTDLTEDSLEQLISTLESETARSEFLDNLRTLLAIEEEEDMSFSFSQMFNIDETSSSLVTNYLNTINNIGLSDTALGKLVVITVVIIIIALLLFFNRRVAHSLNTKANRLRQKFYLSDDRLSLFFSAQIWFGYMVGILLLLYSLTEISGLLSSNINIRSIGSWLLRFTLSCMFIGIFVITLWEIVNGFMEYGMHEKSRLSTSRIRTLMPVVRNLVFFIVIVIMGMVVLSELGVDIVPLLAGAGVLGIAIGFGAQTMVKDFLTGFVIILEDLLQVGDVVEVGGREGFVEEITLRKVQLRNLDGTVHTVPYSEISIVDNMTKEFSYYLMNVGVAYKENLDDVIACLKKVDEELREHEDFSQSILAPLEILGLDEFADSALIIKVRTKTRAHDKWLVGREFNRRIKMAFDDQGIEIPFPHRTLYFAENQSHSDKIIPTHDEKKPSQSKDKEDSEAAPA